MGLAYNLIMNSNFLNSSSGGGSMVMSEKQEQLNHLNQQKKAKQKSCIRMVLMVVVPILVALITGAVIWSLMPKQKELVCTSDMGSITLFYNDKEIVKYTVKDIEFDIVNQNKLVQRKGMEVYLNEFETWFRNNSGKGCIRK